MTETVNQQAVPQPNVPATPAVRSRWVRCAKWLGGGCGLLSAIHRHNARHFKLEEAIVYTVHRAFFLWALILTGFIAAPAVRHHGHAIGWGWIYAAVMLFTFVTIVLDMNALRIALFTGIFAFIWLASRYLEDLKHIPILSDVGAYFRGLHPRLDPGFATLISWMLLIPWLGALFHAFGRGRKVFSPNSIEEWFLGEGREITDRSGLKFRSRYRDLLETLLGFGCGDLEAIDGSGNVVKRYENILFLLFRWRRLDEILHQRSAVVDNAPEDPVEVEDVRS